MKRFLILLLVLALVLAGCGKPADTHRQDDAEEDIAALEEEEELEEETEPPQETQPPSLVDSITYQYNEEDGKEFARVIAKDRDGNEVWTYETPQYEIGQLSRVASIGHCLQVSQYYLVEDGAVVALHAETGRVLWKNSDFGGSPAGMDAVLIDEDGTVYLCGFFGPDFFAVSWSGRTLSSIDVLDSQYYWGHKLAHEGDRIAVYFSGGPEGDMGPEAYVCYVDLPLA